jgi:hypothetical protein
MLNLTILIRFRRKKKSQSSIETSQSDTEKESKDIIEEREDFQNTETHFPQLKVMSDPTSSQTKRRDTKVSTLVKFLILLCV